MTTPMIYFDNSATTPVCPEAIDAFTLACTAQFGNPSSRHQFGREAAAALKQAKEQVMAALGVRDGMILFTSGGTEANNLAILGRAEAKPRLAGGSIITSEGEHASVSEPLAYLEKKGYRVVKIPTTNGALQLDTLTPQLTSKILLATVMATNNETGACYDIATLSKMVKSASRDAVVHTDATQAFLKIPLPLRQMGVDMVTISGHKIGAPKGIGCLWISSDMIRTRGLSPRHIGGGQEGDLRSGTENMPGILAFAAACTAKRKQMEADLAHVCHLRQSLIDQLKTFPEVSLHLPERPAPHILSLAVEGLPSETLLNFLSMHGVCVSAGSACASNSHHTQLSEALLAFGLSEKEAKSTIRVSFSPHNTTEEVNRFVSILQDGIKTLYRKH